MDEKSAPVPLNAARERTIDQLCVHFANDTLELNEFERRLDLANRALTIADLQTLTADLPAIAQTPAPAAARPAVRTWTRARQFMVAIMGGFRRVGRWTPAERTFLLAFWGGAELDFREAILPEGVTEITIVALMGGAEIIVPPDINVEADGFAIMGGFEHTAFGANPSGPTLRINGVAMMGGVDIKVRYPGESGKEARARRREEERQRRRPE